MCCWGPRAAAAGIKLLGYGSASWAAAAHRRCVQWPGFVTPCFGDDPTNQGKLPKNPCFEDASVRGESGWCCRRTLQPLELQMGVVQTWSCCWLCSVPPGISHRRSHSHLHPSCKWCPSELCARWEHSPWETAKAQEWKPSHLTGDWILLLLGFLFVCTIETTHCIVLNAKHLLSIGVNAYQRAAGLLSILAEVLRSFIFALYLSSLVVICSDTLCHAKSY